MGKLRYRTELKYLIDLKEYAVLKSGLSAAFKRDPYSLENGGYGIRSLYFDDVYDTDYFTKLSGVLERKKYRIRMYNNDPSLIKLEKKVKVNNASYKLSTTITREQAESMISGDYGFMLDSDNELLNEIYIANAHRVLRPSVITDYFREAFIYEPFNVRITFDEHLATGLMSDDFFLPDLSLLPVTSPSQMILEVKYDEALPTVAKDLLSCVDKTVIAVSKFTACKRYIALNGWEVEKWG
ncbi:MAG: polyphosphate polymerase domain-containing protein [Eubacteriaceae bacterium]|nr:polyphosphate polymerase domain-containing protein [Eubacteriaceae bacterium]